MTDVMQTQDSYAEAYARLIEGGDDALAAVRPLRDAAFDAFGRLGFPTRRDEEWRFTDIRAIRETPFAPAQPHPDDISADQIAPLLIDRLDDDLLVFVDGRFAPRLSRVVEPPEGVTLATLAEAAADHPELIAQHLARHADAEADAFVALNTALMADGLLLHVPPGVALPRPVHLLSLATAQAQPTMTHPRNLIVVGESAQATVIESYASVGGEVYLTNAVTELVAGDNAHVHHYLIERDSDQAFNVSTLRTLQGRDSNVHSHTILFGGAIVRNNVRPTLAGENGHCLINGLYVTRGSQHMDNHMRVEHAAAHCDSRQFYKGILEDDSGAVFSGRIVVAKGAQKTDAKQTNQNLLMNKGPTVHTQPQLEIYADDVKCTHGATIGELDETGIYYLRTRGIAEPVARAMMVFAFAAESFERMNLEPVRRMLHRELLARLPQGDVLQTVL